MADFFDFLDFWPLGGRECVQNDATGCGIIFHTRPAPPQKLDFSSIFAVDHILNVFDDPWAPWAPLGPMGPMGPMGPHGPHGPMGPRGPGPHRAPWAPGGRRRRRRNSPSWPDPPPTCPGTKYPVRDQPLTPIIQLGGALKDCFGWGSRISLEIWLRPSLGGEKTEMLVW